MSLTSARPPRYEWLTDQHLRLPDGTFPHLGTTEGDVAPVVLLSGSPERVELMAALLDDAERVGDRRGYAVHTGRVDGVPVTVATSGVGSPSMAIAVEELGACGGRTFVRVGSCASLTPALPVGGVAVCTGAVRDEGTSGAYAPAGFPAVASVRVVNALVGAAAAEELPVEVGLTRSTDSFYAGERDEAIIDRWSSLGVLAFEMETSCLCTVAAVRGWEAGSIIVTGSNLVTGNATYRGEGLDAYASGQAAMLRTAVRAAAILGA
ncbi:nucleoside phosphorylase [Iamia sp. SCSIO 61187]|uniref:nucleoside phosphorylase n=1 Tax=Iamia sp. SCSIO 61187 TaxID=2722752 RepID=UPI001C627A53|nr:nucleoside phosphorylase [Iamia sp. SCSIO 61187]QYG91033.1 nucleoside phosphorylase [Iamia sp. SCSIO 61187]